MTTATETDKDFLKFWAHLPWSSQDETLIVLKGHLLVEDLMREFCASKVKKETELEKARLSFSQVTYLTKALKTFDEPSWVWAAVEKINILRNRLAHKLQPSDYETLRDEFIVFVRNEAKPQKELFEAFAKKHEQVAAAIFVTYSILSVNLRFTPQGLLARALLEHEPQPR